jgi:putative CocE/NonD family hydrolase
MGPWDHAVNTTSTLGEVDFGPQALIELAGEELRWLERRLKRDGTPNDTGAPVRLFAMGANEWHDEQEWPLARTQWPPYYLHSGGRVTAASATVRIPLCRPPPRSHTTGTNTIPPGRRRSSRTRRRHRSVAPMTTPPSSDVTTYWSS